MKNKYSEAIKIILWLTFLLKTDQLLKFNKNNLLTVLVCCWVDPQDQIPTHSVSISSAHSVSISSAHVWHRPEYQRLSSSIEYKCLASEADCYLDSCLFFWHSGHQSLLPYNTIHTIYSGGAEAWWHFCFLQYDRRAFYISCMNSWSFSVTSKCQAYLFLKNTCTNTVEYY